MVKLLFFAGIKERIGVEELYLETSNQTIAQLKNYLQVSYPNLQLDGVLVAINEEFALDDDMVQDNDTIAFIPPVSGG